MLDASATGLTQINDSASTIAWVKKVQRDSFESAWGLFENFVSFKRRTWSTQ